MLLTPLRCFLIALCFLTVAIIVARLVFNVPDNADRPHTTALPPVDNSALAAAVETIAREHAGLPGIATLEDGREAFAARILLANAAVFLVDVQY